MNRPINLKLGASDQPAGLEVDSVNQPINSKLDTVNRPIKNPDIDAATESTDGLKIKTDRGSQSLFRFTGAISSLSNSEVKALMARDCNIVQVPATGAARESTGESPDNAVNGSTEEAIAKSTEETVAGAMEETLAGSMEKNIAESMAEYVRRSTRAIIGEVQSDGDAALIRFARKFDNAEFTAGAQLEVPRSKWKEALQNLDPELRTALERSAKNISSVHSAFLPKTIETSPEPGIVIGRRPDPLSKVGVYAPGGRATYPSSVLMGAIPAKVAGVGEVILCSPPNSDGLPSQVLLAAAEIANVDRVFAVGGAGAIAALAYGTETIPQVDRIVGPGNAYVAEAKIQVSDRVAIDSPAGPSELLIVADSSADPQVVAREVMAQAEHDPMAAVVVICIGENSSARSSSAAAEMVKKIESAVNEEIAIQSRSEIVAQSLANNGAILYTDSLSSAAEFSNKWAPEHLLIALQKPEDALPMFINAGTIFVGSSSSVAFGDYMSGANHVLPTGGLARSYSGLSTLDFIRWTTYQKIDRDAAASLAEDVGVFADSEGLPGHARTARQWKQTL